ncbi:putative iron-dependent peroxidase [Amaricoccus macauensis]|uniref:Putative iron-dependent peroxidase n=1 Tax=Amaricoccus macauensis TaxID=57001 RepID=A0A840SXG0_9RHOB|nr:Dyp-type peroxidase [Amaricoccus macauensis]MBB5223903.1 putative iron-dependent peroxidase [Amaricoccus macauensis]
MPDITSQSATGGLTRNAIFLTLTVGPREQDLTTVRELLGDLASLKRGVGFRNNQAGLSCVAGIGATLWKRLSPGATPQGLHPFREINGVHHAPSTPGDLFFHIRAMRPDFCFELATNIMKRLAGVVTVEDETQGFKFFDDRDLLGFVDGTENPTGQEAIESVLIGDEDKPFTGGSYVIVQKYMHDLAAWEALTVERQEVIIGRHKLSDIEFRDADKASYAHNVLTNFNGPDGRQLKIVRDNMPFGSPARGEFGTYFIGYSCEPGRTEKMLDNMFIGDPPGNYDRLLDVSRAVTGSLFFVPTEEMLDRIGAGEPAVAGGTKSGT